MNLTPRQRDLMLYVQRYVDEFGCAPTNQEITDALQLKSKAGTQRLLNGLEERGWLTRIPHRARAITILKRLPDPERRDVAREAYRRALQEIAAGDGVYGQQAWEYKSKARQVLEEFP